MPVRSASVSAEASPLILGSVTPRLWTAPLVTGPPGPCGCGCALTPDTSLGFDWVQFARGSMHREPYEWQRWSAIHGGELLPDGRPRFRYVFIIVARQQGKTEIPVMLSGYWMFVDAVPLILGTSSKLTYAKESWQKLVNYIDVSEDPGVRRMMPTGRWTRETNGEHEAWVYATEARRRSQISRYLIAAANDDAGRSLTVHKLILDELRQHHDYSTWNAATGAMTHVVDAQAWILSNAGSAKSIVLNEARAEALEYIRTGEGDYRTGWFEWSSPPESRPDDPYALAQANPEFNRSVPGDDLVREGAKAMRVGGKKLIGFKTENMCINVDNFDPAFDPAKWAVCHVAGDLDGLRDRTVLVFDVSLDGNHGTLLAAATGPDERTRVEPVAAWSADDSQNPMTAMIADIKGHVRRIRPRAFGWLPGGPAAAYAADLKPKDGKHPEWLPAATKFEALRAELPELCMGFEQQIKALMLLHSDDPLLNAHVLGAERLEWGDRWVITRKAGHVDAAYAAAGAVHLARMLPAPVGKPRLIVVSDDDEDFPI
jgi:hypothetical protein